MESPLAVLLQIARIFDEQRITYAVVGSFASSLRGLYRTTNDIDIVADIKLEQVKAFISVLQNDFYADEQAARRAVTSHRSFNVIHFDSVFKIDIFIPASDEFSQQQLARRQAEEIAPDIPQMLYVATAEDTILAKLKWYRSGGEISSTQWRDILGVIGIQGKGLDVNYLRQWADKLGVQDLLEKVLEEAR